MEKQILLELVNKCLSIRGIAKELGTSPTNVRYWLDKYEIKTSPKEGSGVRTKNYEELETHTCKKCNVEKSIDQFYVIKRGENNKPFSYCIQCSKERLQNQKYYLYKEIALDYKGGKCQVCGYNRCQKALEFHHLNPAEKDFSISRVMSWRKYMSKSEEDLKKELDKCVLLCSNCHRELHDGMIKLNSDPAESAIAATNGD